MIKDRFLGRVVFGSVLFAILVIYSVFLPSCKKNDETVEISGGGDSALVDPPGQVNNDFFYVKHYQSPEEDNLSYRTHINGSSTSDCKIASNIIGTTNPDRIIDPSNPSRPGCLMDGVEDDLWSRGVKLQVNIPPGRCDYVRESLAFYYSYPVGRGPTSIAYTKDVDGNITGNVTFQYIGAPTEVIGPDGSGNYKGKTGMVSQDGTVTCAYDHSQYIENGPNCCMGSYILDITNDDGSHEYSANNEWGGSYAGCLSGPGVDNHPTNSLGWPVPWKYEQAMQGLNLVVELEAPQDKFSAQTGSNTYLTNSFENSIVTNYNVLTGVASPGMTYSNIHNHCNEGDPTTTPCANLDRNGDGIMDPPSTSPRYIDPLKDRGGWLRPQTFGYYMWECNDDAQEVLARIVLQIRDFNTFGQWNAMNIGASYNADIDGDEGFLWFFNPIDDHFDAEASVIRNTILYHPLFGINFGYYPLY